MWKAVFIGLGIVSTSVGFAARLPAAPPSEGPQAPRAQINGEAEPGNLKAEAMAFLKKYEAELAKLDIAANLASWKAANSGKDEDFKAAAAASLALRKYHSDPAAYARIQQFLSIKGELRPVAARALKVAELAFEGNQLPPELLEKMVKLSSEIEQGLNTYRAELDGKKLSNNDLLQMLHKEKDPARRRAIWEALKQVGGVVAPRLVELAHLRNQAAAKLGFANYWQMQIHLQEYDPEQLMGIYNELDQLTREPFTRMKAEMDAEVAHRLGITPAEVMPWDYDNPFFQAAPPSAAVDLDEFYDKKTKEDIVAIARKFYDDIGLPVESVLKRSDLYGREGKDQHAFCTDIDRRGDVRTLLNIEPTAEWMDTILHEEGHAVYELGIDPRLPYNLREPAHIFTTEGIAMLFGALAKTPNWMVAYADADEARVHELAGAILEQRRREQLIFARWSLVMLHFEKALYENPDQDLNSLWWDTKERFQQLKRPPDRNAPDWAAKTHFTAAPVYYHNYQLGELFAAQVRHSLAELAGYKGPTSDLSFVGRKDFGDFLKAKVFWPGEVMPWPQFVKHATGEPLTAKYFAAEVSGQ